MGDTLTAIWANEVYRKLILSAIVILGSLVVRRFLHLLIVARLSGDSPYIYVVRKVASYLVNVLAALLILGIWVQQIGDLSVALGIVLAENAYPFEISSRFALGFERGCS